MTGSLATPVMPERRRDGSMHDALLTDCVRAVLARHGRADWRITPGDFWCSAGPSRDHSRIQGWKLHLSATPLSAPLVLSAAAEILVRHRCPFKFAGTVDRVAALISRGYDRGAGGKFITVYHEGDDDQLRMLAAELHQATLGLPGPTILSDRPYRSGSLVHYRFGVLTGIPVLSNDGTYEAMLLAPDGALVSDQRKAWFTLPTWAPPDPFIGPGSDVHGADEAQPKPVLLDGRYVVSQVIRQAFTGGVYPGTDQRTGKAVIIKQARAHAGADLTGRDVRDARRREAEMLEAFASSGRTARVVGLFEQQGDLFLVQEQLTGTTLRQWVSDHLEPDDGVTWGPRPDAVGRLARAALGLVELVHARGLVLRDLNPNNVLVGKDGQLRLIDLELLARPGEMVRRSHTPGYAAPEQLDAPRIGPAPDQTADLYGLGATLFYLGTGVDPVLPPDEPATVRTLRERFEPWLAHLAARNPAARLLAPVIVELLTEDPDGRPTLDAIRAALSEPDPAGGPDARGASRRGLMADPQDPDLKQMIADAIGHLVDTMDHGDPRRLWPSRAFGATTDPVNVQHGAAGVLGVLTRAYQTDPDPALRAAVKAAAGWIVRRIPDEPCTLPGLYFGRSGTAWALLDAGRILADEELVGRATDLARRVPLRWPNPDVCHGMAGAGLAQLRCWEVTGDDGFLVRAQEAADAVAAAAYRDGLVLWPIPADFVSALGGLVHYGFAHGVAGTGAFLLAAGRATGNRRYLDLARSAGATLRRLAHVEAGAARWPSGTAPGPQRTNWCSGSSGIGTFLVRLAQETGDDWAGELAAQAAVAVRRTRWYAGTAQCHGLAGDGEFLLDLADAHNDRRYRDWAVELALGISVRHALRDGRMVAPDEWGTDVVADFGTGLSGVLGFMLRLRDGGPRLWLPDMLTGPAPARIPRPPHRGSAPQVRNPVGPRGRRGGVSDGARDQGTADAAGGDP